MRSPRSPFRANFRVPDKLGVISPLADFTLSNMSVLDSRHSAIAVVR